jgi:Na+-translocating ferredoxin:NAD+ oxidoreductase subunit B
MISDPASRDAERIDALLPQTQCTRCGYPGCRPYAAAIAGGEAQINQCPPGGSATIHALADLLGREFQPLNPANGVESPPRIAWIDESRCIGCARCLPPCPVDAIVGAAKYLHTVLMDRCTGCELCLAPCPVDCIEMRPGPAPAPNQAELNRERYHAHTQRLQHRAEERQREIDAKKAAAPRRTPAILSGPP